MSNAAQAVAKGVELLDREVDFSASLTNWRSKIDLDSLVMSDVNWCVLGQIYGSYDNGLRALGLSERMSREHGFITDDAFGSGDFVELTREWKNALRVASDVKVGDIYSCKYNEGSVIQIEHTVEVDGTTFHVVRGGTIENNKFTPIETSTVSATLLRAGNLDRNYVKWEPKKFVKGDILTALNGATQKRDAFMVREDGAVWRLRDNPSHATISYWTGTVGYSEFRLCETVDGKLTPDS